MKFALNQIGFSRDATDTLCWRGHNLLSLVEVCGTPSMVYDECRIVDNYNWFKALGQTLKMKSIVAVALKATGNVALLRALRGEGAFCEVMSEEEFSLALASGFTHHEIIVNGLGWADSFLKLMCSKVPYIVNIDNIEDGIRLNRAAENHGVVVPVCLRIVPDTDQTFASTKDKLGTLAGNSAFDAIDEISKMGGLDFHGISVHALHRCRELDQMARVYESTAKLCEEIVLRGVHIACVDLGGGLDFSSAIENHNISPAELASVLNNAFAPFSDATLIFEPGRFLVGDAAIVLTQVMVRKAREHNDWLIVDAGTNILIPLDTAHFDVNSIRHDDGKNSVFNIADGICSPTSVIATDCVLPDSLVHGDFLAISHVGSYALALIENWVYQCPSLYLIDRQGELKKILGKKTARDNFFRSWGAERGLI